MCWCVTVGVRACVLWEDGQVLWKKRLLSCSHRVRRDMLSCSRSFWLSLSQPVEMPSTTFAGERIQWVKCFKRHWGSNCKYKELIVHYSSTVFLLNVSVTPCAPERTLFLLLYTVNVNELRTNLNQEVVSVLLPLIRSCLRRRNGHSTVENC